MFYCYILVGFGLLDTLVRLCGFGLIVLGLALCLLFGGVCCFIADVVRCMVVVFECLY